MSDQPGKHGHQHGPDGPDPIPPGAGWVPKWATAVMFQTSTAKSTSWYYADFTDMGTNDTDMFTLENVSGGKARYLGITGGGLYHVWFSMLTSGSTGADQDWGVNYAAIEPIFEEGGSPTILNSESDTQADFEGTFYNVASEQYAAEQPAAQPRHVGKFQFMALHYDPPSPSVGNYGFEVPFKLGVRMLTDKTGSVVFEAQIHVLRVADAGYTAVSA